MTTALYNGSEGVVTRIYGYEEAVAALVASTPVPPPPPAPTPGAPVPVTLVAGSAVSAPSVNEGTTLLALAVDTAVLDVTAAAAAVGTSFKVLLQVPQGLDSPISVGVKLTASTTATYPLQTTWNALLLEITCLATGVYAVTKSTNA